MGNLSNLYVSRSFQSLIHLATDNTASANLIGLEDGYGNPIGVSVNTAGDLSISGSFTASLQNGYVWVGDSSGKTTTVATSSFGGGSVPAGTISGSAQITALGFVSSSITASSLITASAAGSTITFTKGDASTFNVTLDTGSATSTTTIYETVYTGEAITKGDPLYISGSQGANPIVYKADASIPAKMPVTYIASETIGAGTTSLGIILGLIEGMDLTGYDAGNVVYVAEGGGWSTSLPSGSNSITQLLGVVTKGGSGGKGLVLNPGPAQLPGLDTGKMWVGGVNNQPTEISTASFAITGSNTFIGNQIINGAVSISSSATYDLDVTGAIRISGAGTPQLLITGSTSGLSTTITATQLGIVSASVSSGVTSKVIASSDTTGTPTTSKYLGFSSNPSQTGIPSLSTIAEPSIIAASGSSAGAFYAPITFQRIGTWTDGRVTFNNPIVGLRSLELTGSFTASLTQGYTWVGNGNNISTLVATSSFGAAATPFPYTGSAEITGSLIITGSASGNVVSASISSNTASIDFNLGNYFVVTSSVTPLHLNVTNIKPGTTSTLIISASASSSILFSPNVAQPSGSAYSGSAGSIDILSLVAFNTSKVNVVSTKALI